MQLNGVSLFDDCARFLKIGGALIGLFLLTVCSWAQGTPIVKTDTVGGTIHYGSSVLPWVPVTLQENDKISGTRVEVSCALSLSSTGGTLPAGIKSKDFKVSLSATGGSPMVVVDMPEEVDGYSTSKKFRFATTFCPDGATISIRIEGKFWMQPPGYSAPEWIPTDKSYSFLAYNKLQLLGNGHDVNGNESENFEANSDILTNGTANALQSTHSFWPMPGEPSRQQHKPDVLAKFPPSTVFSAATHGWIFGFQSSYPGETIFFTLGNDTIYGAVATKGTNYPQFNIVGLWACSTLADDNLDPMLAFRTYEDVNRALLGFDKDAMIWAHSRAVLDFYGPKGVPNTIPLDHMLGDHATYFWNRMQDGYTANTAIDLANYTVPSCQRIVDRIHALPMLIKGDFDSTLRYVYLTYGDRFALGIGPDDIYPHYFLIL